MSEHESFIQGITKTVTKNGYTYSVDVTFDSTKGKYVGTVQTEGVIYKISAKTVASLTAGTYQRIKKHQKSLTTQNA